MASVPRPTIANFICIVFSSVVILQTEQLKATRDGFTIVIKDELTFWIQASKVGEAPICTAVSVCKRINIVFEAVLLPVKNPPVAPIKGVINIKSEPKEFAAVKESSCIIFASDIISETTIYKKVVSNTG